MMYSHIYICMYDVCIGGQLVFVIIELIAGRKIPRLVGLYVALYYTVYIVDGLYSVLLTCYDVNNEYIRRISTLRDLCTVLVLYDMYMRVYYYA